MKTPNTSYTLFGNALGFHVNLSISGTLAWIVVERLGRITQFIN